MTKQYSNINKLEAKEIRADLEILLKTFGEARGLEISIGNALFSGTDVEFKKVGFKIKGEQSHDEKQKSADLEMALKSFGLSRTNSAGMEIVEYRRRSHKYPVIYRKGNQQFKTSISQARLLFPVAA